MRVEHEKEEKTAEIVLGSRAIQMLILCFFMRTLVIQIFVASPKNPEMLQQMYLSQM